MRIIISVILFFTSIAYGDVTVKGDYTVKTGTKTIYTKELQLLTEGTKPKNPADGQYYKDKNGLITRWNKKTWASTTETVNSLTGKDKI